MSTFHCPSCGAQLAVQSVQPGAAWVQSGGFEFAPDSLSSAAAPQVEAFQTWTRTTPTRAPTPAGDVVVPLAQSAITGLVAGIASAAVAYAQHWPAWVPVGGFSAGFAVSWLVLLFDHRSLLRVTETITGRDLDGDGRVGKEPQRQTLQIEIIEHHGPNSDSVKFLDLPCDRATFTHIAKGVLAGHPFSEREWAGRGRPMSGPKFRELQDVLLEKGYLRWASSADHRQGVALTHKGEQLFRGVVK